MTGLGPEDFMLSGNDWDARKWLSEFGKADFSRKLLLRRAVFLHTMKIAEKGEYSLDGKKIHLWNKQEREEMIKNSRFYREAPRVSSSGIKFEEKPSVSVIEADTLEAAVLLKNLGENPAVLNMASPSIPGGGVFMGAPAQEESLFRRSTLFLSLFQFYEDYAKELKLPFNPKFSYPIPGNRGGIYSPNVKVFRSSERTGYFLFKKPQSLSFITVAALESPPLKRNNELREWVLTEHAAEATKERIRTIFRIAIAHGHYSLVLGAFGCGAFENPPAHMARLFREILEEEEFQGKIKFVVFAIFDRKKFPENLFSFAREFN